nr:hypothetical protein [Sphingopyxis yananensis]
MASLMMIAGCSGGKDTAQNDGASPATTEESGPAYALITQPVGKSAPADYAQQLAAARTAGEISDVLLLTSKPSEEGPVGFTSLAVVEFPNGTAFDKWSGEAKAKLGNDLVVRRADLLVDDRAKADPNAAYVVNHYEALIPADDYAGYTRTYISPNMDGQKKGGVMTGYAMYYEREPVAAIKRMWIARNGALHIGGRFGFGSFGARSHRIFPHIRPCHPIAIVQYLGAKIATRPAFCFWRIKMDWALRPYTAQSQIAPTPRAPRMIARCRPQIIDRQR